MKNHNRTTPNYPDLLLMMGLLILILGLLFWRSVQSGYVHFSNDGPFGMEVNINSHLPGAYVGTWGDINAIGSGAVWPLCISSILNWLVGPVAYAKFFAPFTLFLVGLGTWTFFRTLKLSHAAAGLGAIAAMLNANFFTNACWGVAAQEIAMAADFFALALVVANTPETPARVRWTRLMLAGLCVGVNVMEAADIGALFSLFIAGFVFYKALTDEGKSGFQKAAAGVLHVGIIAVFAGFIAFQTVIALVGTQIKGVAGAGQETETKAQHWDWATQWSLPKAETLGIVVPGVFGYRMDTPKDMTPSFQNNFRGGNYWGGIGRDPNIDRYYEQGGEAAPGGLMRFSGANYYCGILVALVAALAVAQAFRRQNSPFSGAQKKLIWFWFAVLVLSIPMSWGRFAPLSHTHDSPLFYALLYKLPYFSTIRNPVKFLYFLSWAVVILFAYGVHGLRRQMDPAAASSAGISAQLEGWWKRASQFDRRWTFVCLGLLAASAIGWLIYLARKPDLVHYLQRVGFGDDTMATTMASFSVSQVGWFVLLLAGAIVLLTLAMAGCFNGSRATLGCGLLGAFLVLDLGRADLPYVIHWDYKQKYEVGTLNPIVKFLCNHPYEQRVAKLLPAPLSTPQQFELFDQLYGIEWSQQLFPYYSIQSFDVIQMPREAQDWHDYQNALRIGIKQDAASGQWMLDQSTFPLLVRKWELSNTRYLLGPAPFVDLFNSQFDPGKGRFRIVQRFSVAMKPGVPEFHQRLEELTAYANDNGEYALIEFTGALPRAKLYSNWQVNTNDQQVLKTLADLSFDPGKTVLVDTAAKDLPQIATNDNSGTVEYKSYSVKRVELQASAKAPSVLLLNDKFDPNWSVTVDGKPAELLRCNFIMRGVQLPAGDHTVVFRFSMDHKPLYVTIAALGLGILLCGFLWLSTRQNRPQN